jgi:hypothetical protein
MLVPNLLKNVVGRERNTGIKVKVLNTSEDRRKGGYPIEREVIPGP